MSSRFFPEPETDKKDKEDKLSVLKKTEKRREPMPDPGDLPVDPKKIALYSRGGTSFNPKTSTNRRSEKERLKHIKKKQNKAAVKSVHSELLLTEEAGFLQPDDHEATYQITQKELKEAVDITSAAKCFDLSLDFGPYKMDYFRNGRSLVFGGRRGHVAVFDWLTKELKCEFNVQESVHDVQFLHLPTMFAVAQKDWVHIYDNQGIEMHCLKNLYRVQFLDFLPYHFLLVSASDHGYLSWLDVSIGSVVTNFRMDHSNNRLTAMCHNKSNAIVHTAHPNGTVALWSPNERKPLVKMLSHGSTVRGICVSDDGNFMVTTGIDRSIKLTDLRNYKEIYEYRHHSVPSHVAFSQTNMLAVSFGDVVEIYKDFTRQPLTDAYMRHREPSNIEDLSFVNYEDVLGVGHAKGLSSLLIPGSGEANFDAFESNPFMSTSQRREMEVKALLDKIPSTLISLDSRELAKVDVEGLKRELEEKEKALHKTNKHIKLTKTKTKKGKKAKKTIIQETLRTQATQQRVKELRKLEEKKAKKSQESLEEAEVLEIPQDTGPKDVYSRFKTRT